LDKIIVNYNRQKYPAPFLMSLININIPVDVYHGTIYRPPILLTSQKTGMSFLIVNLKFNKKSTTMRLTKILLTAIITGGSLIFIACGGGGVSKDAESVDINKIASQQPEVHGTEVKESDITITNPVNAEWVTTGKATYELKCQSCHRLTEEKLVGPGWKGVTKRRQPAWILNMITNVEMMLEKDPEAQKLLESCMVRMPNQNLTLEDSRKVLEFMRSNDGEK
jgi:hypothetical protein